MTKKRGALALDQHTLFALTLCFNELDEQRQMGTMKVDFSEVVVLYANGIAALTSGADANGFDFHLSPFRQGCPVFSRSYYTCQSRGLCTA
ncbi:hypothetical protein ES708_33801 [subsurface metagenome]